MEKIVAGTIFFLTFAVPPSQNKNALTPVSDFFPTPIPAPVVSQTNTYEVQTGDTLDSISEKYYSSGKYWTTLWNDNDWIAYPTIIKKGWELKISNIKPEEVEKLTPKLAEIYDKLNVPTPTPSAPVVLSASSSFIGTPSSFDSAYQQAGIKYGVPWQILYGLHLTETGLRDGAITSGYGSGAQGPMQFLPQTWSSYGVDGNGDGNADINNAIDAIFGAANYLALHGGIENGLKFYGGDTQAILNAARSRGY